MFYTLPENWREWPEVEDLNDVELPDDVELEEGDKVHYNEEEAVYAFEKDGVTWYFDPNVEWKSDYENYHEGVWLRADDARAEKVARLSQVLDQIDKGLTEAVKLAKEAGVPLSLESLFRHDLANVEPDGSCWYTSYC